MEKRHITTGTATSTINGTLTGTICTGTATGNINGTDTGVISTDAANSIITAGPTI